jgi:hypothetical protein
MEKFENNPEQWVKFMIVVLISGSAAGIAFIIGKLIA